MHELWLNSGWEAVVPYFTLSWLHPVTMLHIAPCFGECSSLLTVGTDAMGMALVPTPGMTAYAQDIASIVCTSPLRTLYLRTRKSEHKEHYLFSVLEKRRVRAFSASGREGRRAGIAGRTRSIFGYPHPSSSASLAR